MNVISLRLLSLFIAVIYHIIIIIVKIMFVLATRTTEVGTCVSLNHIDHNHLVLYTLSGKRNHHHTLQHVSLDGKYAHIYCKYCILKKIGYYRALRDALYQLKSCSLLHILQIPLDLSCRRPDV